MIKKMGLLPRLILGILLGIGIGIISKAMGNYLIVRGLTTFSSLFGNFLNFFIPFIIIAFVAPGIAELGNASGKMLGLTVLIAYTSTIAAGTIAFFAGSTILPKVVSSGQLAQKSNLNLDPYFVIEIPPVMGVMSALFTAFILGLGMAYIKRKALFETMQDLKNVTELVVKFVIIPFVPLHISGIFAKLTAAGEIFQTLKSFSQVIILILILQICYIIIQYAVACSISKRNIFKSLRAMIPAYFTALGTQSSAATIPVTLKCTLENDISEEITDFVIPLCATIHLAGDTITLVLASMGVMLMDGKVPTAGIMFPFIFMLGITMVAAPGIPGGGVYASLGLLKDMLMFTSPQQGLMIALHLAQDSFGTATNVTGDGAIAILINYIRNIKPKKRK